VPSLAAGGVACSILGGGEVFEANDASCGGLAPAREGTRALCASILASPLGCAVDAAPVISDRLGRASIGARDGLESNAERRERQTPTMSINA
jgi:hypothetical protein